MKWQAEQQPSEDSEEEEDEIEKQISQNDLRVVEQIYTKGSAPYGSIDNLQKATNVSRKN